MKINPFAIERWGIYDRTKNKVSSLKHNENKMFVFIIDWLPLIFCVHIQMIFMRHYDKNHKQYISSKRLQYRQYRIEVLGCVSTPLLLRCALYLAIILRRFLYDFSKYKTVGH